MKRMKMEEKVVRKMLETISSSSSDEEEEVRIDPSFARRLTYNLDI